MLSVTIYCVLFTGRLRLLRFSMVNTAVNFRGRECVIFLSVWIKDDCCNSDSYSSDNTDGHEPERRRGLTGTSTPKNGVQFGHGWSARGICL